MVRKKAQTNGELSERAQHLFKTLVQLYIDQGEPVGSRLLSRQSGLDLSPATVRNVMADLEDLGLVVSPHTSAGRIPTAEGYRLFVDSLLTVRELNVREIRRLETRFAADLDPSELIPAASRLLSGITRFAGLVTLPRTSGAALSRIEFLPLTQDRVLVILVTAAGQVQNRVIHTGRLYTPAELQQASNYLSEQFAGRSLAQVREQILQELERAREDMNALMREAIELAGAAVARGAAEEDYVVAGETNLMHCPDLADLAKLRELFEAFQHKSEMLNLLDRCAGAKGVHIFIGKEAGYQVLDDCSLITAPYEVDDQVVGVLGVIGPTRMAYDRVIPLVDVTARLLGSALSPR